MNLEFFVHALDTRHVRTRLGLEPALECPTPDERNTSTAGPVRRARQKVGARVEAREEWLTERGAKAGGSSSPFVSGLLAAVLSWWVGGAFVATLLLSPSEVFAQGPKLDAEMIRAVAQANQEGIASCYDEALVGNPRLEGRVTLDLLVSSSGRVDTVQIAQTSIDDSAFLECLVAKASLWAFPGTGNGAVRIAFPLEFAVPAGLPEMGTLAAQSLGASAFRERLRDHEGVKACYSNEIQGKSEALSGRLVVQFVIAGDGTVVSTSTLESTLGNTRLEACVLEEMGKVRFPSFAGKSTTVVTYPFRFEPGH